MNINFINYVNEYFAYVIIPGLHIVDKYVEINGIRYLVENQVRINTNSASSDNILLMLLTATSGYPDFPSFTKALCEAYPNEMLDKLTILHLSKSPTSGYTYLPVI